jgi:hypothetical protein
MTFDRRRFNRHAHQLRDHADGYKTQGMSAEEAAAWANHGFTPKEAVPWIAAGFDPHSAATWADEFVSPADARERVNWANAHPTV